MPVLAPLKPFFDGMTAMMQAPEERPPAEARAAWYAMIDQSFKSFMAPREPAHFEVDHRLAVDGGEVTARVYSPARTGTPFPCHIYLHGGGFWMGTLGQSDNACRALAEDAHCVVVSVDYRLAPEHKFPAAPEDCYAALLWVVQYAEWLGIDPSRISIGGPSAGGNLGAVVALMARDRAGPRLVFQLIEIPLTDFTRMEPLTFPEENITLSTGKERYREYYFADGMDGGDAASPYASPLLAADLTGLPPALVTCMEYDSLQPEAQAYADRLAEAAVDVQYHCAAGQFHGSTSLASLIPNEAAAYHRLVVDALRRAFETNGRTT